MTENYPPLELPTSVVWDVSSETFIIELIVAVHVVNVKNESHSELRLQLLLLETTHTHTWSKVWESGKEIGTCTHYIPAPTASERS